MEPLIKIIKTIPGLDVGTFERALRCPDFWKACVDLPRAEVKKINDNAMDWDIMAYFLLDPLGVTKIPVEAKQELHFKEDDSFTGEGKKWIFWTENSNAVDKSTGELFFKAAGKDMKMMLQVLEVDLKAGFLDVAGLGKSMVISRLKQELQNMILSLIDHVKTGKINSILESC